MRCSRILLLVLLLSAATGQINAQSKNCFIIGSTPTAIRNLHGAPGSIFKENGKETWIYGKSSVTFKDGLVSEYDNYGKNLKICKEVMVIASKETKEKQGYLMPEYSKSKATKATTEEWILSKLNANVPQNIHIEGYYSTINKTTSAGRDIKNTSFNIENGNLVVRYHIADGPGSHDESFTIPIWDLKRIHADQGNLVFSTKTNSIAHNTGRETLREGNFSTKFDFETEQEIKARLVSAFAHLQKFYKSPKKKEVF